LATVAALVSTSSAFGFSKPCPVDVDICGWALQADYGYDNEILTTATTDANQDAKQGTVVYDAIYNCYPDGEIVWSVWCGGGGTCDKQASKSAHALCKGEPVDTGNQAPSYGDEEGEYYPPDEEYYP